HGADGARLTAESHTAAIDKVEEIVRREGIDCDFERLDGFLFAPPGEPADALDEELRATHRAGLGEVEKVSRVPGVSFETGPALRFPRQAQFHPLRYLKEIAKAILVRGGLIFERTHVRKIEGGSSAHVETADGPIVRCDAIVVATNSPVNDLIAIHNKQAAYVTYVIGAGVPKGSVPRALYWDTLDPYHYVRVQSDPENDLLDVLIVGGEDHKTGQANDGHERYQRLERWTLDRFPQVQEIEFRWSGQVMEPTDALAFIGRNPLDADNVYISTGDSGQGMTHGTIAGILLTDLIQGRENRWKDLYSPSRITLRALTDYAGAGINVAEQLADYFTAGEVESIDEISAGRGAIVRDGLQKIAVYRDPEGTVHRLSAVCKHLGCVVAWNTTEQ